MGTMGTMDITEVNMDLGVARTDVLFSLETAHLFLDPDGLDSVHSLELVEEDHRRQRREKRIAACGTWAWTLNPATLKAFSFQMKCGYWRYCDDCYRKRVNVFKDRFDAIRGETYIYQGLDREMAKITRKVRRLGGEYWRIPISASSCLVITTTDPGIATDLQPEDLDWEVLANTPEDRSYSGSLGNPKSDEDEDGDHIVVGVTQIHVAELDLAECKAAMEKAIRLTPNLMPDYTRESIEEACDLRMGVFRDEVIRAGGEVLYETTRRTRVYRDVFLSVWHTDELTTRREEKAAQAANLQEKIALLFDY